MNARPNITYTIEKTNRALLNARINCRLRSADYGIGGSSMDARKWLRRIRILSNHRAGLDNPSRCNNLVDATAR